MTVDAEGNRVSPSALSSVDANDPTRLRAADFARTALGAFSTDNPAAGSLTLGGVIGGRTFDMVINALEKSAGSLTLGKTPDDKKINDTLGIVGLAERSLDKVKTFSHGMKQRLGIAQALLCDPQLIMLDEPTNGLDPQGMKEVRELITRLTTERGITVFLSSHLLNEVEQVATRMAIINKGKMIVQGKVEDLLKANANKVLFNVEPVKRSMAVLEKIKKVSEIAQTDEGIVAKVDGKMIPAVVNELVKAKCKVFSVQPKHSLEEYFLDVTTES
jgi:ABC-2 type transport system ATP-binding protein